MAAALTIVKYPQSILQKKAEKVAEITAEIKELIPQMIDSMYEHAGIGLAAPQINISKQIIIVETSHRPRENKGKPLALLNPTIVEYRGQKITEEEGCLSLPGIFVQVTRPESIVLTCLDPQGKTLRIQASGFLARIFQHEIDHLNGKLTIHRINPIKRFRMRGQLKKIKKNS